MIKKKFFNILLFLSSISTYSQSKINRLPNHKNPKVHTVFINGVIGSFLVLQESNLLDDIENITKIDSDEKEMNVIPDEYRSAYREDDYEFSMYNQKGINIEYNLDETNDIYLDGYLIKNKNYKIIKKAIVEVQTIKPDSINKLTKRVLNLWTLEKNGKTRLFIKGCSGEYIVENRVYQN